MNGFIKKALLSAMIGLGAFSAMPSASYAQNLSASIQGGTVQLAQHWDRDRGRHHNRPVYRGCSPREAVSKARALGLRRAHVVDANRRVVTVRGIGRHGPDIMRFRADSRNCQIVRR